MEDVVAAGDGFGPACVLFEVGGEEGELIAGRRAADFEHRADIGLALEVADGGADLMAGGQKLQDGMGADEAGAAGDEDCAHCRRLFTCLKSFDDWAGGFDAEQVVRAATPLPLGFPG